MKERFLTGLKNAAVIIIASLMLLGVIPLGMISHISTVNAEGDFLRFYPETETSLMEETGGLDAELMEASRDTHRVGKACYSYLRFDIRNLLDQKKNKVTGATLRLVFMNTGITQKVPVKLWLMQTDDWSESMKWKDRPSQAGEIPVASITLTPNAKGEPKLFEVDLTDYVKSWIEEERETVSFRLDSTVKDAFAVYAGSGHEDPLFRPCLKVVTGTATDPDEKNLQKISLNQKYGTQPLQKGIAVVGAKDEIYLKFSLNDKNINGDKISKK